MQIFLLLSILFLLDNEKLLSVKLFCFGAVQMFEWVQSEDIKQNNKTQKQLDHVKRVEIDSIR